MSIRRACIARNINAIWVQSECSENCCDHHIELIRMKLYLIPT